jgi:hypothetical protein
MTDVRDLVKQAVGSYEPRGDLGAVERRVERHRRTQQLSAGVVAFAVFAAAGWFAWTAFRPGEVTPGSTPTAPPAVVSIPLGELPEMGVAVASGDVVELVALDGTVLQTLRGYALVGNAGADGVWLRRGEQFFRLDLAEEALVPVPTDEAGGLIDDEGPEPSLAPPSEPDREGGAIGSWRFALESGSGITLAQWSDECDDPQAYWLDQTGAARLLTGDDRLSGAPASLALGWAQTREAIALVQTGSCGGREDDPGIYLFSAPGSGRLVHATTGGPITADAWGTGL